MRIMLHIIIWITNFNNISNFHGHKVLARTRRLHYIYLHELGIWHFFHIDFSQLVCLDDILFTFCGFASAIANVFPFHFLSKQHCFPYQRDHLSTLYGTVNMFRKLSSCIFFYIIINQNKQQIINKTIIMRAILSYTVNFSGSIIIY